MINSISNTLNLTNNTNNDQSNRSSILHSSVNLSTYNKEHLPHHHHQVSFSMPTTPIRKESTINQNNPLKIWHKDGLLFLNYIKIIY